MSLCETIETLSMAFLDDELAPEERRELELHLIDCTGCRQHVDHERTELSQIRARLVAPPAPDLLKARIAAMLDTEDRTAQRSRLSRWLLPGSAVVAAAAALLVFVSVRPSSGTSSASAVAVEAARQQGRPMPLEVQGPNTGHWIREHFAAGAAPPQFQTPGIEMVGARLTAINGHDAYMVRYMVTQGRRDLAGITAVVVEDINKEELGAGQEFVVGERTLHVLTADGIPAVTYVSPAHVGYAFFSPDLTHQQLLEMVVTSDLIERAQSDGR
jgi:anti-sigma factor RsiW